MVEDHRLLLLLPEILHDDGGTIDETLTEQHPNDSGMLVLGSAPYEYSYRYHVRSSRHKRRRSADEGSNRTSDDRALHYHRHGNYTAANYTITTSVSIRVTPVRDHFVSWGILWGFLVLTSLVAAYQVYRECVGQRHRKIVPRHRRKGRRDMDDEEDDVEDNGGADGEGEISTADVTRSLVSSLLWSL